jgi:hypothetical protein
LAAIPAITQLITLAVLTRFTIYLIKMVPWKVYISRKQSIIIAAVLHLQVAVVVNAELSVVFDAIGTVEVLIVYCPLVAESRYVVNILAM